MTSSRYARITAQIVAAYVSNNHVARSDVADVVDQVIGTLGQLSGAAAPIAAAEPQPLVPAVAIRKSIEPDFIVCLEDGKRFRSLKRHLATKFGLSPDEYRRKWGLPSDYPMVAPNYAAARSQMAKTMGLGRKAAIAMDADVASVVADDAAQAIETHAPSAVSATEPAVEAPAEAPAAAAKAQPKRGRPPRKLAAEAAAPSKADTKVEAEVPPLDEAPARKRAPRKTKTAVKAKTKTKTAA